MKRLLPLMAAFLLLAACVDDGDTEAGAAGGDADVETDQNTDSDPSDDAGSDPDGDVAGDSDGEQNGDEDGATDGGVTPEDPAEEPTFTGDGSEEFCAAASEVEGSMDSLGTLLDPVQVEAELDDAIAAMNRAVDVAPDEIRADVETSAESFMKFADALADVEYSLLDLDTSVLNEIDADPANATADRNIDIYNYEICGIGTDPALDEDPADSDEPLPEGTMREQTAEALVELGFNAEEAGCILENIDLTDVEVLSDPSALLALFEQCDIPLERLSQLGG